MEEKGTLGRPRTATSFHSNDFEWEELRDEVETMGLLQKPFAKNIAHSTLISTKEAWQKFHERHSGGSFFKERRYLVKEFPELLESGKSLKVLEVGCGTGCSVIPILRANKVASVYGCDCSRVALRKAQGFARDVELLDDKPCRFFAFYCDICNEQFPRWVCCDSCRELFDVSRFGYGDHEEGRKRMNMEELLLIRKGDDINLRVNPEISSGNPESSRAGEHLDDVDEDDSDMFGSAPPLANGLCCIRGLNIVMMIFTLSSIPLEKMHHVIRECYLVLEPGGTLLFRDYGLYDMTMLRFPPSQKLGDSLYQRSDGTLSYFFVPQTLRQLFTQVGFVEIENKLCCVEIRNRQKSLSMRRVYIHAKFYKPNFS